MIMTEVGFKCPACIGRIKSHATEVSKGQLILGSGLSLAAGFLFGLLLPYLLGVGYFVLLGIPVLGLLLCYLTGRGAGALVQRAVRYKVGMTIRAAVLTGGLVGLLAGPFGEALFRMFASAADVGAGIGLSATSGVLMIRLVVLVMAGLLFLRGLKAPFSTR